MTKFASEKKRFTIHRARNDTMDKKRVYVPGEAALTLFVNGKELITLLCSPTKVEALAVGFLHTEGLLASVDDIRSFDADLRRGTVRIEVDNYSPLIERMTRKRTLTTGCGRGTLFYHVLDALGVRPLKSRRKIRQSAIHGLMKSLLTGSEAYRETGGIHSAGLGTRGGKLLVLCEDLGRHNAVDKVFGECLLRSISPAEKVLLTSGRISSDMLIKALKKRVSVVGSTTSPTSLAVDMAHQFGLTLVGYVRGGRMNVYAHSDRIILK